MQEKPDKWKSPEQWADEQSRTFKLYLDIHWFFGPNTRSPNSKPAKSRLLNPDLQRWLDMNKFPHKVVLGKNGRSRVIFEQKSHAVLFKLTWV